MIKEKVGTSADEILQAENKHMCPECPVPHNSDGINDSISDIKYSRLVKLFPNELKYTSNKHAHI
jgi:hypothetical protein